MSRIHKIIETYGLTDDIYNAGLILPDGTLVNLKRKDKNNKIYHIQILDIFNIESTHENLKKILKEERMIRFCMSGLIHVENKLTQAQINTLLKATKYIAHSFKLVNDENIEEASISSQYDLDKFFGHLPYVGNDLVFEDKNDKIVFMKGEERTGLGVYTKRTNKLMLKSKDLSIKKEIETILTEKNYPFKYVSV